MLDNSTIQPCAPRAEPRPLEAQSNAAIYKNKFVQAFNTGRFIVRAVFFDHWDKEGKPLHNAPSSLKQLQQYNFTPSLVAVGSMSLRSSETEYQQAPVQPRPASSLMAGVSSNYLSNTRWHYDMNIVLIAPEAMAFCKRNAYSRFTKSSMYPEEILYNLKSKLTHSYNQHIEKRREIARRWESLYPNTSEGHFNEKGLHTGCFPKILSETSRLLNAIMPSFKTTSDYFELPHIPVDEITTTGYRPEDYQAIAVYCDSMLCPWQPLEWIEFHEQHASRERPLPVVYYDLDRNKLTIFNKEDKPELFNGSFAAAVIHINRLIRFYQLDRETVARLLFRLPPEAAIDLLITNSEKYKTLADAVESPEAKSYVALCKNQSTLSELKALFADIEDPNRCFPEQNSPDLISLLFQLSQAIDNPAITFTSIKALPSDISPITPYWELGRLLIEKGLKTTEITLDDALIQKNPLLAAELFMTGASVSHPEHTLIPLLAAQLQASNSNPAITHIFNRTKQHLHQTGQDDLIVKAALHIRHLFANHTPAMAELLGHSLTLEEDSSGGKVWKSMALQRKNKTLCDALCALLETDPDKSFDAKQAPLQPDKVPPSAPPCYIPDFSAILAEAIQECHTRQPLELDSINSLTTNAQKILEKYYLMPSSQQIQQSLHMKVVPWIFRLFHGTDHVVRTMMNTEWVSELFIKHQLDEGHLGTKACQLLQYAALYHDISAEVEDKKLEEVNAAKAMDADLKPLIPEEDQALFDDVISALRNKNVNTMQGNILPPFTPDEPGTRERLFRRVLRMADSIEMTRCTRVDNDFIGHPKESGYFSLQYSDSPEAIKHNPAYRAELIAGVENMMDLGFMTGGRCQFDQRKAGNYGKRFGLRDSQFGNNKRQLVMNRSPDIYTRIQNEQKRVIAQRIAAELKLHYNSTKRGGNTPVIQNDDHLTQFIERIQPVIDTLSPLERQTFSLPENLQHLVVSARKLVPEGWRPEQALGTLSQIDLEHSPKLRTELQRRGLKVIKKTFQLPEGPHSIFRVVSIDDKEPEAALSPAAESEKKKLAQKQRITDLEQKVRQKFGLQK